MFASSVHSRTQRRGIVLVLILGMLGLLALIGVTFATFSNQAQINARNFSQAASFPDAPEMFDFALAQLINDTSNPQSVIRGHSLKRDMYGSDATNNGALLNGMLDGTPMTVTGAAIVPAGKPHSGMVQLTTNIPSTSTAAGGAYYSYDFTRWIMTYPGMVDATNNNTYVGRTHEILIDDAVGDSSNRQFYIALPNYDSIVATGFGNATSTSLVSVPPFDSSASTYGTSPTIAAMIQGYTSNELGAAYSGTSWRSALTTMPPFLPSTGTLPAYARNFTLDGRFLRAFNGPGVAGMNAVGNDLALLANSSPPTTPAGHPLSEYANFRYNGNIYVNVVKSASNASASGTFTPGYGDPNFIPVGMDEDYDACDLENWFLAIQSADGKVVIPSFHRPGIVTGADWLRTTATASTDAGLQLMATRSMSRILRPRQVDGNSPVAFPDLTPDSTGAIHYDVDNDGDGATDSVWLDLGYPPKRGPEGQLFKPLYAFMVLGLNGRLPLNTAGNLQQRDDLLQPMFDHAEHLGNSPSEIDLKYALQNAWVQYDPTATKAPYQQGDNAGVSTAGDSPVPVNLTQLRNILTGTRPWDPKGSNGDQNQVVVNSQYVNLPNNMADLADTPIPKSPGDAVYRNNAPVAGRWGEADYVPGLASNPLVAGPAPATTPPNFTLFFNNAVRAGFSVIPPNPNGSNAYDARDDNFNTFDFNGEAQDFYDAAGALSLPVERIRRFVTPIDLAGDGRVITYNTYRYNPGAGVQSAALNGADLWGRVSFLRYFRPPGVPLNTFSLAVTPPASTTPTRTPLTAAQWQTVPAPLSAGNNSVWYDPGNTPPAGTVTNHLNADPAGPATNPYHPYFYDTRTNNLYHGFVNALSPDYQGQATGGPGPNGLSGLPLAGMPTDLYYPGSPKYTYATPPAYTSVYPIGTIDQTTSNPGSTPPAYITAPTYSGTVNSMPNFVSPGLNEADEMDLYTPNRLDAAFGPGDLEWLYRYQDVDGAALTSRLASLAPISLLNPADGPRRRRLFSLDTWDTNSFVWANDNPQGVFPNNSRFNPQTSASFTNLYNMPKALTPDPAADFSVLSNSSNGSPFPVQTPALAHRDRRVNLNFPLPVSNSPTEPIRQKWLRETYQLLKAVLPPRAVDTPEELAQLSQYVVNMLDFRDPDATMTKFVNTDLIVTEPPILQKGLTTAQATLAFSTAAAPAVAYDPLYTFTPPPPPTTFTTAPAPVQHYLIQYGMEYQPVAINEVLAYQFQTKNDQSNPTGSGGATVTPLPLNDTPRMLVEMVNMLTKDSIQGNYPDSSDLDLANFDFVVLPDDAHGRPDPYTGQVPLTQPGLFLPPAAPVGYAGPPLLPGGYYTDPLTPANSHWYQPFVSIPAAGGSLAQLAPTKTVPAGTGNPQVAPTFGGVTPTLSALGTNSNRADTITTTAAKPSVYYYVFGNFPPYQGYNPPNPNTGPADLFSETVLPPQPPGYKFPGSQPGTTLATTAKIPNTMPSTLVTQPVTSGTQTYPSGYVDLTGLLYQRAIPPAAPPATVPAPNNTTGATPNTLNPGYYYWLYLRRPANPFDPTSDRVVVDSFRFVFTKSQGIGYQDSASSQDAVTPQPLSEYIFSLQRLQPYRGGHAIPPLSATTSTAPTTYAAYAMASSTAAATSLIPAYGYSEQTSACQTGTFTQGVYGSKTTTYSTDKIYHTLGQKNSVFDNARDYFPFNDRDYTSVIELLSVPATSPGLFTKQFAEVAPPLQPTYQSLQALAYTTAGAAMTTWPAVGPLTTVAASPPTAVSWGTSASPPPTASYPNVYSSPWPQGGPTPVQLSANGAPHSVPYLNDEFYYTGASEPATWTTGEATVPSTTAPNPTPPATFRAFNADANGYHHYIGGPGAAGFHKMLDFFEVPTPAFKAIGEVAGGVNYDWARQDLRPGLLNLNLIIDEEVFFGLMGNSIAQYLNTGQIGMPNSPSFSQAGTPSIVTQVDDTGQVTGSYHMPSVGYYAGGGFIDPFDGLNYPGANAGAASTANAGMKAAFADFLSLRHGASGYVFGYGTGGVGSSGAPGSKIPVASERPFHSLSYPDINYTIMRPAALPPTINTTPNINPNTALPSFSYPLLAQPALPATPPTPATNVQVTGYAPFVWDPGLKNPYLSVFPSAAASSNHYAVVQPPPIPPRRLFQVADAYGSPDGSTVPTTTPVTQPSNASIPGDPSINTQVQLSTGLTLINGGTGGHTSAYPNLVAPPNSTHATVPYATIAPNSYLAAYLGGQFYDGSQQTTNPWVASPSGAFDQTDHPYFRTEWLQKVTNLTTVRTHQYAVWITVGFFEVTAAGDASLATSNPFLAYDQLGNELGYLDGSNKRYRGFFLIDRTRAVGFNPFQPDDFRSCVVYRQLIE